jgi:hypothetical protein
MDVKRESGSPGPTDATDSSSTVPNVLEGIRLVRAFTRIQQRELRETIIQLVEKLAET